jgi:peptide/nickel transport system substrate-binding protein
METQRPLGNAKRGSELRALRVPVTLLIGLLLVASACGAPSTPGTTATEAPPTTLTIGVQDSATTLDPYTHTTVAWQNFTASMIEQLVYFDPDKPQILPGLATSWRNVDDKTLELKLRQGVKFTNGEAFDAASAKYSLDMLIKAAPYSIWSGSFASVEAVGTDTIRVISKQPTGIVLPTLARGSYMYPATYHKEQGEKFGAAPVGTGPYKFVSYEKGSLLTLEANPNYWGGKPTYTKLMFRIIPEEAARVAALKTGEVQLITQISGASIPELSAASNVSLVKRTGLRQSAAFFDTTLDTPIKNKLVRQALNYAVDKQALVKLFGGEASVLEGQFVTSGVPGFNTSIKAYPYDPAKAKQLLAQAGFPNGFETTFAWTIGATALDKEMGQAVAGYFEQVGLKLKQQPLEYATFRTTFREGQGKIGPLFQWALLTPPDPEMTLSIYGPGSLYRRFPNGGTVDELMTAGAKETDPAKRAKIYSDLLAFWHDDPFGVYLIVPNDLYGAAKNLKGFTPRADQMVVFDVKMAQ